MDQFPYSYQDGDGILPSAVSAAMTAHTAVTAHAAMASHHLVGEGGRFASVHDQCAAVELACAVVIERTLGSDIQCAAVDEKIPVGVHGVSVAGAHDDGDRASVELCSGSGYI